MDTNAKRPESHDDRDHAREELLQWLDEFGDEIYSYARARVESETAAEELVQETYLAALRNHAQFQGRSQPKTWLIAILRNKIVEHYRQRSRQRERQKSLSTEESLPFDTRGIWNTEVGKWPQRPDADLQNQEFWAVFEDCLSKVPASTASAFVLRVVDGTSTENVCKTLGITATNLAVRLHRARLLLRNCLGRNWFGEE